MGENSKTNQTTQQKQTHIASTTELEGKYLTYLTDNQLYGVPIQDVVQIVGMQEITEVPEFPNFVKGIINLRGTIIPVMDLRVRLGKTERAYDERTCIIVTNMQHHLMGFIADGVDSVLDIDVSCIAQPPVISGEQKNSYLTGIAKLQDGIALLINTSKLLGEEECNALLQAVEE